VARTVSELGYRKKIDRAGLTKAQVRTRLVYDEDSKELGPLGHFPVGLRGYAQLDPLLEFKQEAHSFYEIMRIGIRSRIIARLSSTLGAARVLQYP
jgi:hypothetical protein